MTKKSPSEIVAQNIIRIREDIDRWGGATLSRAKLARACGWSDTKMLDIEWARPDERKRRISVDEIATLCRATGATLFDLLVPSDEVDHVVLRESDPPKEHDLVARSAYMEMLFHMPSRTLEAGSLSKLLPGLLRNHLRRQVLSQHPEVVSRIVPYGDDMLAANLLGMYARYRFGETADYVDDGGDPLPPEEQVQAFFEESPNAEYHLAGWDLENITLDMAFEESRTIMTMIESAMNSGIAYVERQIRAGRIPEPNIPEEGTAVVHALDGEAEILASLQQEHYLGVRTIATIWLESIEAGEES